jgi:predicted nucleotidyltransferase
MSTQAAEPFLARFLLGGTRSAVLTFLYRDPTKEYYLRQVIAGTGGSPGTVQREVRLLVSIGLVARAMRGSQAFYSANRSGPVYEEIRAFLGKTMFGQQSKSRAGRNIFVPDEQIADFCRRNHITKLSFFGSVLRDDFNGESDIDVLVEFAPGHTPGWDFFGMEEELSQMLGRKVDLCTPDGLRPHVRETIVREAVIQYAA